MKKSLLFALCAVLISSNALHPVTIGGVAQHTGQIISILIEFYVSGVLFNIGTNIQRENKNVEGAKTFKTLSSLLSIDMYYKTYTWYLRDRIWKKSAEKETKN